MPRTIDILGTPIACVTYQSALDFVIDLVKRGRPSAVSACNTHIIARARRDPDFGRIMKQFDLILPDGMPLVWTLNIAGASLEDRVYGPYFMREVLKSTPAPWKHFFFGGRDSTLKNLRNEALDLNPELSIVGTYSPPFRKWNEEDLQLIADEISRTDPDFVWVALGGQRQERWIIENQHRFRRGVFFAVGDAFELLAGSRTFAPRWMQRAALTWVYRLWQEPSRLWRRYLRYNTLFFLYLIRDGLRGNAFRVTANSPVRIAFLGSRGVPARYSGFETVVEELGTRLAARGHSVTVYNRPSYYNEFPKRVRGMRVIYIPTVMSKSLETIIHTILSFIQTFRNRYDLIYLCGVGNAPLALLARLQRRKIVINTDGVDFRRQKWNGFARWWLRWSERMAIQFAHRVIVDNGEVVKHYERDHRYTPDNIPYGANLPEKTPGCRELDKWGLSPGNYILYVSRLTPENEAALLLRAYRELSLEIPLVIVGSVGYEIQYGRLLNSLATPTTILTGQVFGQGYRELSSHCRFFVLPAAIEATRLVLLDQMGFGNAILFRDVRATREVIADTGEPFSNEDLPGSLKEKLQYLADNPEYCRELGARARERARLHYDWETVTDRYEKLLCDLTGRVFRSRLHPGRGDVC
jgi:N-acetylglucosaminyldiphosphoundecaprenol N-acetyl-beta-D-mannosaminyltransferase